MRNKALLYIKIILSAFLLAWMAIFIQYVYELNKQITFSTKEQYGTKYHQALMSMIRHLQNHRGQPMSYRFLVDNHPKSLF